MDLKTLVHIQDLSMDPRYEETVLVLLNTTVAYEASLAIGALRNEGLTETEIVSLVNARSFLAEMGHLPLLMGYDFDTLAREGTVVTVGEHQYIARVSVPTHGEMLVELCGTAKTCEWIRFVDGFEVFELNPPGGEWLVNPKLVSLILRHPPLMRDLQLLYQSFGVVFNPREYMTVEGFILGNAAAAFESLASSF